MKANVSHETFAFCFSQIEYCYPICYIITTRLVTVNSSSQMYKRLRDFPR